MKSDKAKKIRELSQFYFNKKKKVAEYNRAGKEAESERAFFEMKWFGDSARKLIAVGDQIKVKDAGWVTIESIQKGTISPVGLCCSNGHLYEAGAILEIK